VDPYKGKIYTPVSLHRYIYANQSPINFGDPSGLLTGTLSETSTASTVQNILYAQSIAFNAMLIRTLFPNLGDVKRADKGVMRVQIQIGHGGDGLKIENKLPPGVLVHQVQLGMKYVYTKAITWWPDKYADWLFDAIFKMSKETLPKIRANGGIQGRRNLKEEIFDNNRVSHRLEVENIKGRNLVR
jgi:hypothetical protein